MSKHAASLDDFLSIFEDVLNPEDVISAKLISQVSSAIAAERLRRGLSQKQLAEQIGRKQSEISRWESGDYTFTTATIARICAALDLEVNMVFRNQVARESGTASFVGSYGFTKTIRYSPDPKNETVYKSFARSKSQEKELCSNM